MTDKPVEQEPQLIEIPLSELDATDVSEKNIERMARGYILGSQSLGRRREIRHELEERVVKRIGRKGKYLTDKLFELIEGIYMIDKKGGTDGRTIRYYQVPPSLQAIIYALDRVLGKPTVRSEVSEEKRGVMIVETIIRNLAGEKNEDTNDRAGSFDGPVDHTAGGINVRAGAEPLPERLRSAV